VRSIASATGSGFGEELEEQAGREGRRGIFITQGKTNRRMQGIDPQRSSSIGVPRSALLRRMRLRTWHVVEAMDAECHLTGDGLALRLFANN
jgi:hypothetical protein